MRTSLVTVNGVFRSRPLPSARCRPSRRCNNASTRRMRPRYPYRMRPLRTDRRTSRCRGRYRRRCCPAGTQDHSRRLPCVQRSPPSHHQQIALLPSRLPPHCRLYQATTASSTVPTRRAASSPSTGTSSLIRLKHRIRLDWRRRRRGMGGDGRCRRRRGSGGMPLKEWCRREVWIVERSEEV